MKGRLRRLDRLLGSEVRGAAVRLEDGRLVVPGIEADGEPPSTEALRQGVEGRLPLVDITSLLIEIDARIGFSRRFTHPGGHRPTGEDHLRHLYASILAQGCNMPLADMAQSAGRAPDRPRRPRRDRQRVG